MIPRAYITAWRATVPWADDAQLEDLGRLDLSLIDWVIVGGESGPGARPMDAAWVRSIRDQCADASIPFFFKQWGGVRKGTTGRQLDGRTYDGYPGSVYREAPAQAERLRRKERATALAQSLRA